jgi:L-malate glycosyltransferase
LLSHCDVLVFPSIAAEALPRMPQEAMACGLVVVGTTTGGTRELLLDGETGLTFPAEDDETLSNQLLRLAREPELRRRLAQAGRQTILEKFTMDRMVDEIESYLQEVVG